MRFPFELKASRLDKLAKGALFALKRRDEPLVFGVMLSEQDDQNAEVKILLLNPSFSQTDANQIHRVYSWHGTQECISFGNSWVIVPNLEEACIRDYASAPRVKQLALTSAGLHFCATHGDHSFYNSYLFSVETLDPFRDSHDEIFYLSGYRIFMSAKDHQNDKEPIFVQT